MTDIFGGDQVIVEQSIVLSEITREKKSFEPTNPFCKGGKDR